MLVPQPLAVVMPSSSEPHGWNTETLKTPLGDFEFKNGFPVGDTEERLRQLLTLNRATEVYLAQLMPASEVALREGLRASARPSYSGRPLGRSDGCQDDAADRQHRDGLWPQSSRFAKRWPDGSRSTAAHAGKAFKPDDTMKALLFEAARLGGAMARANTYGSASAGFYYPDRKWQGIQEGITYTFAQDGAPQIDARNNIYYMAAGNSPAMMEKNVGQGSQYLWAYRDRDGNYLDGARNYRLHIGPQIPAKNFWSVVDHDALSRSELQNGQALPSVSVYSKPKVNEDGSLDIFVGPDEPKSKGNWIRTVPGKGLFPIFRFYGPTQEYFDKTWKLEDIVAVEGDLEAATRMSAAPGRGRRLTFWPFQADLCSRVRIHFFGS